MQEFDSFHKTAQQLFNPGHAVLVESESTCRKLLAKLKVTGKYVYQSSKITSVTCNEL